MEDNEILILCFGGPPPSIDIQFLSNTILLSWLVIVNKAVGDCPFLKNEAVIYILVVEMVLDHLRMKSKCLVEVVPF